MRPILNMEVVRRPTHQFDLSLDKLNGHMNTFYTDLHLVNNAACGIALVAINLGTSQHLQQFKGYTYGLP